MKNNLYKILLCFLLFCISCTKSQTLILIRGGSKTPIKIPISLVITKNNTVYNGKGDTLNSITIKASFVTVKNVVLKGGLDSVGLSVIATNNTLTNILIDNVTSTEYSYAGINIDGGNFGIRNVTILNSNLSENGFAGLQITCNWPQIINDSITIKNIYSYNNKGINGQRPHTGHGIIISGTNNAVVDSCKAWNNGYLYGTGNIGIWTYDSKNITIQNCISYKNQSTTGTDGGGFDIDGGVSNSIIQNCISYENDGAGYLLYEYGSPNSCENNTFKNNTSTLDGQGNTVYSGFSLGGVQNVYNTTLEGNIVTPITGRPAVTYFNKQNLVGLTFIGNNF